MSSADQTWQTTDEDLARLSELVDGVFGQSAQAGTTTDIAFHQLIQTRRLAGAAERQAAALERIAECAAPHDNTPEGEPVFWVGKAY